MLEKPDGVGQNAAGPGQFDDLGPVLQDAAGGIQGVAVGGKDLAEHAPLAAADVDELDAPRLRLLRAVAEDVEGEVADGGDGGVHVGQGGVEGAQALRVAAHDGPGGGAVLVVVGGVGVVPGVAGLAGVWQLALFREIVVEVVHHLEELVVPFLGGGGVSERTSEVRARHGHVHDQEEVARARLAQAVGAGKLCVRQVTAVGARLVEEAGGDCGAVEEAGGGERARQPRPRRRVRGEGATPEQAGGRGEGGEGGGGRRHGGRVRRRGWA